MYLYHGTTKDRRDSLAEHGLLTMRQLERLGLPVNYPERNRPDETYLTDNYYDALSWGERQGKSALLLRVMVRRDDTLQADKQLERYDTEVRRYRLWGCVPPSRIDYFSHGAWLPLTGAEWPSQKV